VETKVPPGQPRVRSTPLQILAGMGPRPVALTPLPDAPLIPSVIR